MKKEIIFKIIRISLIPYFIRLIFQRKKITVLYYHNIDALVFAKHLKLLKKKYSIISFQDFINGRHKDKKYKLIITFDDGYKENYKLLPFLKEYQAPITIFACSGLIDTNRHFWFLTKGLGVEEKKHLKKVPNKKRLSVLKESYGFEEKKEYDNRDALLAKEMKEMSAYVDFQSHTVFHPCLPFCEDHEAYLEIFNPVREIEAITGKEVNALAFPNGDFCQRDVEIAKGVGYKCLLTAKFGYNAYGDFIVKRLSINDTHDLNELIVRASGVWAFIKIIRKSLKL